VAWLLDGERRPDYGPLRHPISSPAIGGLGWMQHATFIITGLLMLAFTLGLRRALRPRGGSRSGSVLLSAFAVGLIGAGLFIADPLSGYPHGSLGRPLQRSLPGVLHDLFGVPAFLGLPVACLVFARRFPAWHARGWAIYSMAMGALFGAGFTLACRTCAASGWGGTWRARVGSERACCRP